MRSLFITVTVLAALLLPGCDFLGFRDWEWRQRLVLEVETPTGVVSGGSVVAVYTGTGPKWLPGEGRGGMGRTVEGEASFVEIAPGKHLFALLDSGGAAELALTLFFPNSSLNTFERAERLETLRETREVSRERYTSPRRRLFEPYPKLVTFTDINDPASIRLVNPDDLATAFGPGVKLKRITLEITDDPVTAGGVEPVLGWMNWVTREISCRRWWGDPLESPRRECVKNGFCKFCKKVEMTRFRNTSQATYVSTLPQRFVAWRPL